MVKVRIDTEDPALLEAMRLCGTDDPAVAISEALRSAIKIRTRQVEVRPSTTRENDNGKARARLSDWPGSAPLLPSRQDEAAPEAQAAPFDQTGLLSDCLAKRDEIVVVARPVGEDVDATALVARHFPCRHSIDVESSGRAGGGRSI